MKNNRFHKYFIISIIVFSILYSLISLVNHYLFRTYALDLGVYTNALYDYSHLQFNDSTVFKSTPENLLADHFDLYLIIISPLSLIFKSYTLLIVQILMILIGALGIYKLFSNKKIAFFSSLYFLSFFGVFSAISFDYHSNVVASCLVPWLFLYIKKEKIKTSIFFFILILVAKENMALWTLFISIGLFLLNRKNKKIRWLTMTFAISSIIYFILVIKVIMPFYSNNGNYHHFHYSYLGSNPAEAITYLISHPVDSFKMLFINHNSSEFGDYIKLELHIFLLLAGLPLLLKKPAYFLMLIPIYFQKLFHDNFEMWGIQNQYSIEFAPILAIGLFSIIQEFQHEKIKNTFIYLIVFLNLGCSIRLMDNTVYFSKNLIT